MAKQLVFREDARRQLKTGIDTLAKAVATSVSLTAGGSGGAFMPSLFMGAAVGTGLARLIDTFWTGSTPVQSGAFAVVGDLNASPWSWSFGRLTDGGALRNSQIGFGLQPTFSANSNVLFRVPIDHLLHSGDLTVVDRRLGDSLGSDHFSLIVELAHTPAP